MMLDAGVRHAAARHRDRRDCVFEDQLLQIPRLQDNGEFVEAANLAGEFDAADQIDRHIDTISAESVEEAILYVLTVLIFHFPNRPSLKSVYLLLVVVHMAWLLTAWV